MSMLMSALAGIVAVCLMITTFYCIRYAITPGAIRSVLLVGVDALVLMSSVVHHRRQRGFGPAGAAGYQTLDGCANGMSAEQMRALPVVIAEKCSSRRNGSDGELQLVCWQQCS